MSILFNRLLEKPLHNINFLNMQLYQKKEYPLLLSKKICFILALCIVFFFVFFINT